MKAFFILISVVLAAQAGTAQTIRRVNNNPGVTGVNVYSSAQDAHDAAAANDILLIEPSNTGYGTLTLTKPLKIYGNGYLLDVNTELKLDDRHSVFDFVQFNTGSDGSAMYGIQVIYDTEIFGVSNITIERCRLNVRLYTRNLANFVHANVSDITIRSCTGAYVQDSESATSHTISAVLISNCIFGNVYGTHTSRVQNWIVRNNHFNSNPNANPGVVNSVFENNLWTYGTVAPDLTNTTYSYNVSNGNSFPGGIGNQNNYDINSDLTGAGTGISEDEAQRIKAGSSLKTAASDGGEVGAFGGVNPYVISGVPAIPAITAMENTATGSNEVPLQVTISVKSNN